jgi:very-short-patch-repair endonuclease
MRLHGTKEMRPQSRQNIGPNLEEIFQIQIRAVRLPPALREYRFHPKRKWLFDFAWPQAMIAVEIEGGTHMRGRHVRPEGFRNDCIKYSEAALLGWKVLRGDSQMVKTGALLSLVERALTTTERE